MGHIIEDIERTVPGAEIKSYISVQFNENVMATPKNDFERWVGALTE